jgi:hypothetical protein
MATSTPKTAPTNGGAKSNNYGGKTNEQMKKLGRTAARYAAQGKKV